MCKSEPRWWHAPAQDLVKSGYSWRAISKELGIPKSTVSDYLRGKQQALATGDNGYKPKILLFDIETSPNLAFVWGMWQQNVSPVQMKEHSHVLCYAAKWLDNDAVFTDSMQGDEDDRRVCETLWELFDEADVVIGHNGIAFDEKTMRARWVYYGLNPPSPYRSIDTLKLARAQFRFQSNKLDYLGRYLDVGQKVTHTGFQLWLDCLAGDKEAWTSMITYNIQDVYLLEAIYLKLRAWDTRSPNLGMLYHDNKPRCVCCGNEELEKLRKKAYTNASEFNAYRCVSCGKVMRARKKNKLPPADLASVQSVSSTEATLG